MLARTLRDGTVSLRYNRCIVLIIIVSEQHKYSSEFIYF
jgi:hypothetical protein